MTQFLSSPDLVPRGLERDSSSLPLYRSASSAESLAPKTQVERPVVVVAEDEAHTRSQICKLLREQGIEVHAAASGREVLELATRLPVDLFLLDVVMPGIDGVNCCRLVKGMRAGAFVPVILLTQRADPRSRVEGLRIGADDYICKPYDEPELLARVQSMLRIKKTHDEIAVAKRQLEDIALRDGMTGLYNYRYLSSRLQEEFKRAERRSEPLACMMVDVDHFKRFNDRYGHDMGDRVLIRVADVLRSSVREIDVVARYGGEEFALLLPNTSMQGALTVALRITANIALQGRDEEFGDAPLTLSIGVALYPNQGISAKEELLKAADQALYAAKERGRNRVCFFRDGEILSSPSAPPSEWAKG